MRKPYDSRTRVWARKTGLAVAVAAVTLGLFTPGAAQAATEPALETPIATIDAAIHCPQTFAHPEHEPVLLIHGTALTYASSWERGYAPALRSQGYDVCGIDLPERSMGDIQSASEYVVRAVDKIYAATGRKVDIIGHSQGTLEPRWALKYWPHLQSRVDDMIGLSGPDHGVDAGDLFCVFPCQASLSQMRHDSDFLNALNTGDETPGPVSYTTINSRTDELILSWTTARLAGAKNITIQDVCPGRVVGHVSMLFDGAAFRVVTDALSHSGPADPDRLPLGKCLDALAPTVGPLDAASLTVGTVVDGVHALQYAWGTQEPALKPYAVQ
ncbi:lipase family protein [Streptomyces sp. NBC_00656]|uniref:esterase/lipase family protein n=1 Tax=Streptomyces sp. NBC_00656 TaxID=2903668 RepID=UPI003247AEFF